MKVIGKPKPKVKWLRDGEEIFASEEYQIENFEDGTSVLVINNVYPDDVGTISFEAYNPLGIAVTTALFSVEGIYYNKDYIVPILFSLLFTGYSFRFINFNYNYNDLFTAFSAKNFFNLLLPKILVYKFPYLINITQIFYTDYMLRTILEHYFLEIFYTNLKLIF